MLQADANDLAEATANAPVPTAALVEAAMQAASQADFAPSLALLESADSADWTAVLEARDAQGRSVLHWAALCGLGPVTDLLLQRAAKLNLTSQLVNEAKTTDSLQTAFHWATAKSHLRVLWLLHQAGADITARDSLGATAAVLAVQHGCIDTLLLLLHWEERLTEVADINGCLPAHWAAYKGDLNALRVLHFANPMCFHLVDRQGMTPLHRAVSAGFHAVHFLVMECLVNPAIVNSSGQTARDLAVSADQLQVAAFLAKFEPRKNNSNNKVEYSQVDHSRTVATGTVVGSGVSRELAAQVEALKNAETMKHFILPCAFLVYCCVLMLSYVFLLQTGSAIFKIFTVPALTSFVWLVLGDPGYRPRRAKGSSAMEEFQKELAGRLAEESVEESALSAPSRMCLTCWEWKSLRSKHCAKCDKCCEGFDHCCPWINNDVASKNHRLFIVMLFFNVLALSGFTACLLSDLPDKEDFLLIRIFTGVVETPALFGLLVSTCFFLVFGGVLFLTQLRIVATNMNTNELLNMHRYPHFWQPAQVSDASTPGLLSHLQSVAFVNPFDKGVIRNCLNFWTGRHDATLVQSRPTALDRHFRVQVARPCCDNHDKGDVEMGGLTGAE